MCMCMCVCVCVCVPRGGAGQDGRLLGSFYCIQDQVSAIREGAQ